MRLGIDFDNTIAGYDALFAALAEERGLFARAPRSKRALRDALRRRPDGEAAWRGLQAEVYGPRMADAELIDGVADFLGACFEAGIEVHVVSHKTRQSNFIDNGVDLHIAALDWMAANGFFGAGGLGLSLDRIHFADTRADKVARIAGLGCRRFIDDLEEVFVEPGFPKAAERILFDPAGAGTRVPGVAPFRHWREITEHVFGHSH